MPPTDPTRAVSRITAIETQERKADRRSLFVDGRFLMGVGLETVEALGLRVGQAVRPEDLERIAAAEERRRCKEAALLLLSYRARSEDEMRRRLLRRGFEEALVDATLEELRRQNLLNDRDFAEMWVRNRQAARPSGKALLRWELRQKGVDSELTEETLEPLDEEAELEAARELLDRRLSRSTSREDPQALRQRLLGVLRRRGFSWETCRKALDELNLSDETWQE